MTPFACWISWATSRLRVAIDALSREIPVKLWWISGAEASSVPARVCYALARWSVSSCSVGVVSWSRVLTTSYVVRVRETGIVEPACI